VSYQEVTRALIRRFGPTNLIKVHEQALSQLRLSKGQNIRELAQEVQRLVKQAYPDIIGPPRDRLAVKHLLNAIPDKDTAFYVREKNPTDVSEACTLYERYVALIHDKAPKRPGVRRVDNSQPDSAAIDISALQRQVTEAIERMNTATNEQLQKFTQALSWIQPPAVGAEPTRHAHPPSQPPHAAGAKAMRPSEKPNLSAFTAPRNPCSQCSRLGHWGRDCPQKPRQSSAPASVSVAVSQVTSPVIVCHR